MTTDHTGKQNEELKLNTDNCFVDYLRKTLTNTEKQKYFNISLNFFLIFQMVSESAYRYFYQETSKNLKLK